MRVPPHVLSRPLPENARVRAPVPISARRMAHRIVTDAVGTSWQVWSVDPDTAAGRPVLAVAAAYASGWLAFEQVDPRPGATPEKRRLAPVPAGCLAAPEHEVLALLAAAAPVVPRGRRGRLSEGSR